MKKLALLMTASGALVLAACHSGTGKAADARPPIAHIDGQPVSAEALDAFSQAQAGGKNFADLPLEQRDQIVDSLLKLAVVAHEGEKQGLAKDSKTAAQLELVRMQVLARAAVTAHFKDAKPTDAELKAEYDSLVAKMPKEEFQASHILVDEEAKAKDLIAQLEKGAKFATLATANSKDTGSAAKGGDLGWFPPEQMVKPFSAAVALLKDGEYTHTAVQSQFGWHIILRTGARPTPPPPPFEQVKDQIAPSVEQKRVGQYVESLQKNTKIERHEIKVPAPVVEGAPVPAKVPETK
jgi:peptidyl-prolyl cis-trans isomerase C